MTSPFEVGRADARRGHTANPYGTPHEARRWELGHDKERSETPGLTPRFSLTCGGGKAARKDRLL